MIKYATRRNLKYPLLLLLFNTLRDIDYNLIRSLLDFHYLSILHILMFFGEFLGGLIYYIKEIKFLSKNKKINIIQFTNIGYYKPNQNLPKDNIVKRIFLIFVASFYDFVQFLISLSFAKDSIIFEQRFKGLLTIYTALFSYFLLRIKIYKHHRFSIYFILLCIIILTICEFIFLLKIALISPLYFES